MERKIGEIFEYNGEWYQCVEGDICADCAFAKKHCNENPLYEAIGSCNCYRKDVTPVIFKKLEKVGEPFTGKVHIQLQRYKIYTEPKINSTENVGYIDEGNTIAIEIKQNKEDMEEKKLNLKPFDLEAAKDGKPVYTRDGRKARIVPSSLKNKNFPIIAIVDCDGEENVYQYDINGVCDEHDENLGLMMLPEKKEGWVNVYRDCDGANITKDDNIYSSKEAAKASAQIIDGNSYVATTKINWEG